MFVFAILAPSQHSVSHNIQTIKVNYRGEPGLAEEALDHSPVRLRHENRELSPELREVTPRCHIKHNNAVASWS